MFISLIQKKDLWPHWPFTNYLVALLQLNCSSGLLLTQQLFRWWRASLILLLTLLYLPQSILDVWWESNRNIDCQHHWKLLHHLCRFWRSAWNQTSAGSMRKQSQSRWLFTMRACVPAAECTSPRYSCLPGSCFKTSWLSLSSRTAMHRYLAVNHKHRHPRQ